MLTPTQKLAENLTNVRDRIAAACLSVSRSVTEITLLAVSKGHDSATVAAAAKLGLRDFGENYLQEALPKMARLDTPLRWHFIGQLQSNKTSAVAENFAWVHTVDRVKLAERLSAQRPTALPPLNVSVQLKLGDEPSKGGVKASELIALLRAVQALPRLRLRGILCIPPEESAPLRQRAWFADARAAFDAAVAAGLPLDTLSMGMSGDLEAAIAARSTMLRVGTALFGPRL